MFYFLFDLFFFFFFSSRRRHTRLTCDWSSDVCSSDLPTAVHWSTWVPVKPLIGSSISLEQPVAARLINLARSEERRVGKECRSRWLAYHLKKKKKRKK